MYPREEKSAACPVVLHCNAVERNEKRPFYLLTYPPWANTACALTSRASFSLNLHSSGLPSLPLGYCSEVYEVALLYEVSLEVSLNTLLLSPLS